MGGGFFNGTNLAEILSGIAIPAGAALMYRHGRLGGPLGAALTGFGGLGLALGERQNQNAKNQQLAKAFMNMPGLTGDQQKFAQQWFAAGGDPQGFSEMWKSLHPTAKNESPRPLNIGGREYTFDPNNRTYTPAAGVPVVPPKPVVQKPFQEYQAAHPGAIDQQIQGYKALTAKAPKSIGQIGAESEARTMGAYRAKEKLPLNVLNSSLVVLSNDPSMKIMPSGTLDDVQNGKGTAALKTDIRQLRQAQTAYVTLDNLEKTIDTALPKEPGIRSAMGLAGRKLTDIVKPGQLAKFKVTQVAAGDAFIRALTQRGNKDQFNQAMNSIVAPNATVDSARASIQQAKQIISDMKDEISGRAGAAATAAPIPAVGGDTEEAEPPPPPGYE